MIENTMRAQTRSPLAISWSENPTAATRSGPPALAVGSGGDKVHPPDERGGLRLLPVLERIPRDNGHNIPEVGQVIGHCQAGNRITNITVQIGPGVDREKVYESFVRSVPNGTEHVSVEIGISDHDSQQQDRDLIRSRRVVAWHKLRQPRALDAGSHQSVRVEHAFG